MRKRLFSLIMAVCMVFSLLPVTVSAEETCTEHVWGEWEVLEYPNPELSLSGGKVRYCTVCGADEIAGLSDWEEPHPDGYPITLTKNNDTRCYLSITQARPGHRVFIECYPIDGAYISEVILTSSEGVEVEEARIFYGKTVEIIMPEGPLNIELVFAYPESYPVNVTTNGNCTVGLDEEDTEAYEGELFTILITPDPGYELVSFEVISHGTYEADCDDWGGGNYHITMPDGPIDIIITIAEKSKFPIAVYTTVGGTASVSVSEAYDGEYFNLTFQPDPGYRLDQIVTYSDGTHPADGYEDGANSYTIIMPDGALLIEVSFILDSNPFRDVKSSDYFYEPVLWAATHGITSGIDDAHFAPSNACTRAQVVTFLWRSAGEPEPESTVNPFTDVKKSAYYYDAVLWAVENGITTGMSKTSFSPNSPCTRGQVVTFLWRFAGEPEPNSAENPFRDVKSSAFYYDAVLWAVEYGITSGMGNGSFAPNSTCTRGQIVTFLYRAIHG